MPTFNGRLIVPMPAFPAVPRSVEWQMQDLVASAQNPFTGQMQTQAWNAGWLEASLSYQPMTNAHAVAWVTWLMALQGTKNVFQFGDPLNTTVQEPALIVGPITVSGAGQTGFNLVTTGGHMLNPGDWIQIGYRLHKVTSVTSDTLGIWPQIRESPADGTTITISNTQGIWQLKSVTRKISVKETKIYGLSFEIREAI